MSHAIRQLHTADFDREVLARPGLHLVDFGAPWCAPCRTLDPVVASLATAYRDKLHVAKVDVDEDPALGQRYEVRSLPTLLFIRDGQVVDALVGAVPRRKIEERLARLLP
jgi:thioredoxin